MPPNTLISQNWCSTDTNNPSDGLDIQITHIEVDRQVGRPISVMWRNSQTSLSFQAEARLAARRQARYEARNIRMRELERKQKEEEDNNGSLNTTSSHQLIQNTSSTNSNHNSIHSGKKRLLVRDRMSLKMVQSVVTRKGLWLLSTDVVGNRVKYSEFNEGRKVLESSDIEKLALKLIFYGCNYWEFPQQDWNPRMSSQLVLRPAGKAETIVLNFQSNVSFLRNIILRWITADVFV